MNKTADYNSIKGGNLNGFPIELTTVLVYNHFNKIYFDEMFRLMIHFEVLNFNGLHNLERFVNGPIPLPEGSRNMLTATITIS